MAFQFANISTESINAALLNEKFNKYEYGDTDVFYISKEIFHHDPENQDDWDFEYRYGIRVVDWQEYGDVYQFSVELHFVPLTENISSKLSGMGYDYENINDYLHSNDYVVDAISEGYTIQFGREDIDYGKDCLEEEYSNASNEANSKAEIAANVFVCINSMRGFYLDRYVNRIGTTGWDMLNDWVYGKGDYINATLARYK